MLMHLVRDFVRAFYAPKSLYEDIAKGRVHNSWLCVLIYGLIYVVGTLWLYLNGFTPFEPPWLKLPEDIYYLVQTFYILPLVFLMWTLGTGVLHILSKPFGGSGSFDILFRMTGYALWAPWYPLIVVDCIQATPEWLYNAILGICMVLILIGTTKATMVAEKIKWPGAVFASIVAFASIGLILFTYIR